MTRLTASDLLEYVRLEVADVVDGITNLVANPDGALGGWGWVTPVAGSGLAGGTAGLTYRSPGGVASFFYTEPIAVTAGQYVAASWTAQSGTTYYRARLQWLDINGTVLSSSSQTPYATGADVRGIGPLVAPASTQYVRLRFDHYQNATGSNPGAGAILSLTGVTVCAAATSGELAASRTNLISAHAAATFDTGTSGWAADTGASVSRSTSGNPAGFAPLQGVAGSKGPYKVYVVDPIAVTGGLDYTLSAWMGDYSQVHRVGIGVTWLNSAGKAITDDVRSKDVHAWARFAGYFTAPVQAHTAKVWFRVNALDERFLLDRVMFEQSSQLHDFIIGTETIGQLDPLPPAPYRNLMGDVTTFKVERDELDVGMLTFTLGNAFLTPENTTIVRPGRKCRLMVNLDPDTDDGWQPIFTGVTNSADADYSNLLAADPARRASVTVTAIDNVSALAAAKRPEGVATITELPYVLEGAGVPWNVNGSGQQVTTATVVATNDNASAVDQVAVTRDTVRGYAWVDRFNVLQVWDAGSIDESTAATLTEADLSSSLKADFNTDVCINSVNVDLLTYDPANPDNGTTTKTLGPYINQASIDEWDTHEADFTVQGISEASVAAYAAAILTANSTPQRMATHVDVPIGLDKLPLVLLDLYAFVRVISPLAGLDQTHPVTGISHEMSIPDAPYVTWTMGLDFTPAGTVAQPIFTPRPSVDVTARVALSSAADAVTQAGLALSIAGSTARDIIGTVDVGSFDFTAYTPLRTGDYYSKLVSESVSAKWRWSGSAWVAQAIRAEFIDNLTATVAAFGYATIAALNAGTITVGGTLKSSADSTLDSGKVLRIGGASGNLTLHDSEVDFGSYGSISQTGTPTPKLIVSSVNLYLDGGTVHLTGAINTATNLSVDGDLSYGGHLTSTSTERSKINIRPVELDPTVALRWETVTYERASEVLYDPENLLPDAQHDEDGLVHPAPMIGNVAEQMYAVSPDLVTLDEEGKPASVRTNTKLDYLVATVQDLATRMAAAGI